MTTQTPSTVVSNAPRVRAARHLKQWIQEGVLPDGQPLPTEQSLAERLEVSRGTLRSALEMLSEEGLLRSNGGRMRIVVKPEESLIPVTSVFSERASVPVTAPVAATQPIRVGIIGAWTGHSGQFVWNNIASRTIEKVASEQANVTLCYFNRCVGLEEPRLSIREAMASLSQQGVERFALLFRTAPEEIESLGVDFDLQKTPLVCIQDEGPYNLPICQIYYDLEHSGYQAADHLLRRGWRSLVAFAPYEASWIWQRLRGIESAIRMHGLAAEDVLTVWPTDNRSVLVNTKPEFFHQVGRDLGRELLGKSSLPCGIIAPNDMTAYGVLEAAREMKLVAGVDFGLIGFDDSDQSRALGVSSLRPPIEAMSAEAIRLLLAESSGSQMPLRLSFRSELIARTSSDFYASQTPNTQGK